MTFPITIDDVLAARDRIRAHIAPTAARTYAPLDALVGEGIRVVVKHENHAPTNAFKARNALSVATTLSAHELRRGMIAATRGNHGAGVAWAGALLGAPVVVCVPRGNNPEKNAAIRGWGAELVEEGKDYDESVVVMQRIAEERGMRVVHSTNDPLVVAGAGTLTLELLEQAPDLDAMVVAVGGGSQAVGALTVARAKRPAMKIYGVQAERASAIHDSWHARAPRPAASCDTFADGLATRGVYELTFPALLSTTHNLAEGAGAAGLAGLFALRRELAGKRVGVILSGANVDLATLARVVAGDLRGS